MWLYSVYTGTQMCWCSKLKVGVRSKARIDGVKNCVVEIVVRQISVCNIARLCTVNYMCQFTQSALDPGNMYIGDLPVSDAMPRIRRHSPIDCPCSVPMALPHTKQNRTLHLLSQAQCYIAGLIYRMWGHYWQWPTNRAWEGACRCSATHDWAGMACWHMLNCLPPKSAEVEVVGVSVSQGYRMCMNWPV